MFGGSGSDRIVLLSSSCFLGWGSAAREWQNMDSKTFREFATSLAQRRCKTLVEPAFERCVNDWMRGFVGWHCDAFDETRKAVSNHEACDSRGHRPDYV